MQYIRSLGKTVASVMVSPKRCGLTRFPPFVALAFGGEVGVASVPDLFMLFTTEDSVLTLICFPFRVATCSKSCTVHNQFSTVYSLITQPPSGGSSG